MNIRQFDNYKMLRYDSMRHDEAKNLFLSKAVNGLDIYPAGGFAEYSLDALMDFKDLKALCIQRLPKLQLDKLSQLPNLEYLTIDDNESFVDFENLPNLICFGGDWHKGLFKNVQHSKLKKLRLWKYKSTTNDLLELTAFSELEELKLVQSTVTSLYGISAFKNLSRFEMHYMNKLKTLGELDLPKLTFLHADFCKKITNHEKLQGCQNLETLRLHNCGAIKSVQFIKKLKKLKSLRFMEATEVVDGDLSPLLDLEDVLFTQKKHYSHKTKDFNQHA